MNVSVTGKVLTSSLAAAEYLQVVVCVRGNKQGPAAACSHASADEIVDRRILLEAGALPEKLPSHSDYGTRAGWQPQDDAGDSEFLPSDHQRIDPQQSHATERKVLWRTMAPVRKRSITEGKLKKSLHEYDGSSFTGTTNIITAAVAEDADLYIAHDLPMLRLP